MSQHRGQEDEVERWEQERRFRVWMEDTGPPEPSTEYNPAPAFGVPVSICAPSMAPSLTESDESSLGSRDDWRTNHSVHSSSSDHRRALTSGLPPSSMPPPSSRHPPPRQEQEQHPSQSMIEISPGVQVRLRGADETWKAIEQDYYMPTVCLCCQATIFCIQNADYVLCPDCRVVSRMEDSSSQGMGGVGLGFKYEDLARWQADILQNRQEEEHQRPRQSSS
jgi:hypothetical protein